MPHLLHMHWLWLFGALSLGIFAGWLTYLLATTRWDDRLAQIAVGAVALGALLLIANALPARYGDRLGLGMVIAVAGSIGCYLLATSRWNDRPLHIGIGALALGVLVAIAKVVPARYGQRLDLVVVLAVFGAIGCFVGWALRNLAEFEPALGAGAMPSAPTTGSYLFRDALAGIGADAPYMRGSAGHGGPAPVRTAPRSDALTASSAGAFDRAPAPGGYTFPKTLPFADATTGTRPPAKGARRHWSWPAS